MKEMLAELFYGNINPSDMSFSDNKAYLKAMAEYEAKEKELLETLEPGQKELLASAVASFADVGLITDEACFQCGFQLGMKLLLEALQK